MPFALAKGWKTGASVGSVQCTCKVLHGGAQYKRMAKDFSRSFYNSQSWKNCRDSYMESVNHLCERCLSQGILKPAAIVHHKIELTPDNVKNPNITLNHNNLQAVCRECHEAIHNNHKRKRRYDILEDGSVIILSENK